MRARNRNFKISDSAYLRLRLYATARNLSIGQAIEELLSTTSTSEKGEGDNGSDDREQ